MEIEILKYEPNHYSVTINDDVFIQTTLANNYREESMVIDWEMAIRKMYGKKKNKKKAQTLAVGLFAEHSLNYKGQDPQMVRMRLYRFVLEITA